MEKEEINIVDQILNEEEEDLKMLPEIEIHPDALIGGRKMAMPKVKKMKTGDKDGNTGGWADKIKADIIKQTLNNIALDKQTSLPVSENGGTGDALSYQPLQPIKAKPPKAMLPPQIHAGTKGSNRLTESTSTQLSRQTTNGSQKNLLQQAGRYGPNNSGAKTIQSSERRHSNSSNPIKVQNQRMDTKRSCAQRQSSQRRPTEGDFFEANSQSAEMHQQQYQKSQKSTQDSFRHLGKSTRNGHQIMQKSISESERSRKGGPMGQARAGSQDPKNRQLESLQLSKGSSYCGRPPASGQNMNKPPLKGPPAAPHAKKQGLTRHGIKEMRSGQNSQRQLKQLPLAPEGNKYPLNMNLISGQVESLGSNLGSLNNTQIDYRDHDSLSGAQGPNQQPSQGRAGPSGGSHAGSTPKYQDCQSLISGISGKTASSFQGLNSSIQQMHPQVAELASQQQQKELIRQKDLLKQLELQKNLIKQQLLENERVMQLRMAHLDQEKLQIERKVNVACVTIQRFVRRRAARLRRQREQESGSKQRLADALAEMENAVKMKKIAALGIDESAMRIQRAARAMIARKRFRTCLYKMILFKNIVENKVHKEKMAMLFAFEQLIINTEEEADDPLAEKSVFKVEEEQDENLTDEERVQRQIMKLTNVSKTTSSYILEALLAAQAKDRAEAKDNEFELDPADVIKEEDFEDSFGEPTSRNQQALLQGLSSLSAHKTQGKAATNLIQQMEKEETAEERRNETITPQVKADPAKQRELDSRLSQKSVRSERRAAEPAKPEVKKTVQRKAAAIGAKKTEGAGSEEVKATVVREVRAPEKKEEVKKEEPKKEVRKKEETKTLEGKKKEPKRQEPKTQEPKKEEPKTTPLAQKELEPPALKRENSQTSVSRSSDIRKSHTPVPKPKPKSPTRATTPPILQRQRSKERRREEERQAKLEAEQQALVLVKSKSLNYDRMLQLCQPRKKNEDKDHVTDEEREAKKPKLFSQEEIRRQQRAIARLSAAATRIQPQQKKEQKQVFKKLKTQMQHDKKRKEEKERRRQNAAGASKLLAITAGGDEEGKEKRGKGQARRVSKRASRDDLVKQRVANSEQGSKKVALLDKQGTSHQIGRKLTHKPKKNETKLSVDSYSERKERGLFADSASSQVGGAGAGPAGTTGPFQMAQNAVGSPINLSIDYAQQNATLYNFDLDSRGSDSRYDKTSAQRHSMHLKSNTSTINYPQKPSILSGGGRPALEPGAAANHTQLALLSTEQQEQANQYNQVKDRMSMIDQSLDKIMGLLSQNRDKENKGQYPHTHYKSGDQASTYGIEARVPGSSRPLSIINEQQQEENLRMSRHLRRPGEREVVSRGSQDAFSDGVFTMNRLNQNVGGKYQYPAELYQEKPKAPEKLTQYNETTPALQKYISSLQSRQKDYINEQISKEKGEVAKSQQPSLRGTVPATTSSIKPVAPTKEPPKPKSDYRQILANFGKLDFKSTTDNEGNAENDDPFLFNIKKKKKLI